MNKRNNIMNSDIKVVKSPRIGWVDLAKGIAILLVIFGHSIGGGNKAEAVLRGVIFSFHMPLFFILSCLTFKPSNDGNDFLKKTEKGFRHLILPAIILFLVMTIHNVIIQLNNDKATINMSGGGIKYSCICKRSSYKCWK